MQSISLAILLVSTLALAEPEIETWQVDQIVLPAGNSVALDSPPRFAFKLDGFVVSPKDYKDYANGGERGTISKVVVARAIDGKEVWVSADVDYDGKKGHVTALFDAREPIAWHTAYAGGKKAGAALPDKVDAGAAEVVKKLRATLADPKAFAKTVSQRNDVVLFGSDAGERTVGGNEVRAQLVKWNLGFKIRDGVQAGVTSSKKVAWVAANVDATKPGDKRTSAYRALFVYEKHDDTGWDLVQLHFSAVL